jgi:holo-[acyl-carrier protein] synthase
MILGVGVDIVEIQRIKEAINRNNNFLDKVFTSLELDYLKSRNFKAESIAGRFASKEAVAKALGTGFRGFGLKDIEIGQNDLGKPTVTLKGTADDIASKNGKYNIHISISHSSDNAIAYAVLESEDHENRNVRNIK